MSRVDEQLHVMYLLGELSAEASERHERVFFEDETIFEELCAVETELVRDFVTGSLPEPTRKKFEARCEKVPALAEKVREQTLLLNAIAPARVPWPWRTIAFSAACVVLSATTALLWLENRRLGSSGSELEPRAYAFTLSPGRTRSDSSGQTRLRIPPDASDVVLSLKASEAAPPGYRVVLRTVDAVDVWGSDLDTVQYDTATRTVVVRIPATVFSNEDYLLYLIEASTSDTLGTFSFRVVGR